MAGAPHGQAAKGVDLGRGGRREHDQAVGEEGLVDDLEPAVPPVDGAA